MKVLSLIILLLATSGTVNAAQYLAEKPPFMTPCGLSDANFNSCFANNFQPFFHEWKNGIPGLKHLGSLDPLQIKRVKIQQDSGPVLNIKAELENMLVYGVSQSIVKEAFLDKKRFMPDFKIAVPKLRFECDYKAQGTVLALNINSHGKALFEAGNVVMSFHITTKLRDEGGFTFTDVDTLKVAINEIGNFHVNLDNLFGGQRELEESANQVFNENWRQLYDLLRPALEQTMQLVLDDRFKKIFSYVPANYLIHNMPTAKEFYG